MRNVVEWEIACGDILPFDELKTFSPSTTHCSRKQQARCLTSRRKRST